ncbi:bromodomain-containing protein [Tieghemostelium lacteum]|uniref:Bromodomain-containing protein n=1 Tax=Tieghemostelium lacteum TaxID=361077 RepID=A0A151ZDV5_TIELA|nr:bromodomain-containing protein [Tieghemostelium lacteum]|eukprot:KYQ92136.1 bromodomain-containing protein [Tieghemostelium lacteum]
MSHEIDGDNKGIKDSSNSNNCSNSNHSKSISNSVQQQQSQFKTISNITDLSDEQQDDIFKNNIIDDQKIKEIYDYYSNGKNGLDDDTVLDDVYYTLEYDIEDYNLYIQAKAQIQQNTMKQRQKQLTPDDSNGDNIGNNNICTSEPNPQAILDSIDSALESCNEMIQKRKDIYKSIDNRHKLQSKLTEWLSLQKRKQQEVEIVNKFLQEKKNFEEQQSLILQQHQYNLSILEQQQQQQQQQQLLQQQQQSPILEDIKSQSPSTVSSQMMMTMMDDDSKNKKRGRPTAGTVRIYRSLLTDVKVPSKKWIGCKYEGQEDFYESLDSVLTQLKATEYAYPFLHKVKPSEAPNYYDIIKKPMDISLMGKKLKKLEYLSKLEFQFDLNLIITNCRIYNTDPSSRIYVDHANQLEIKSRELMKNIKDLDFNPPSTSHQFQSNNISSNSTSINISPSNQSTSSNTPSPMNIDDTPPMPNQPVSKNTTKSLKNLKPISSKNTPPHGSTPPFTPNIISSPTTPISAPNSPYENDSHIDQKMTTPISVTPNNSSTTATVTNSNSSNLNGNSPTITITTSPNNIYFNISKLESVPLPPPAKAPLETIKESSKEIQDHILNLEKQLQAIPPQDQLEEDIKSLSAKIVDQQLLQERLQQDHQIQIQLQIEKQQLLDLQLQQQKEEQELLEQQQQQQQSGGVEPLKPVKQPEMLPKKLQRYRNETKDYRVHKLQYFIEQSNLPFQHRFAFIRSPSLMNTFYQLENNNHNSFQQLMPNVDSDINIATSTQLMDLQLMKKNIGFFPEFTHMSNSIPNCLPKNQNSCTKSSFKYIINNNNNSSSKNNNSNNLSTDDNNNNNNNNSIISKEIVYSMLGKSIASVLNQDSHYEGTTQETLNLLIDVTEGFITKLGKSINAHYSVYGQNEKNPPKLILNALLAKTFANPLGVLSLREYLKQSKKPKDYSLPCEIYELYDKQVSEDTNGQDGDVEMTQSNDSNNNLVENEPMGLFGKFPKHIEESADISLFIDPRPRIVQPSQHLTMQQNYNLQQPSLMHSKSAPQIINHSQVPQHLQQQQYNFQQQVGGQKPIPQPPNMMNKTQTLNYNQGAIGLPTQQQMQPNQVYVGTNQNHILQNPNGQFTTTNTAIPNQYQQPSQPLNPSIPNQVFLPNQNFPYPNASSTGASMINNQNVPLMNNNLPNNISSTQQQQPTTNNNNNNHLSPKKSSSKKDKSDKSKHKTKKEKSEKDHQKNSNTPSTPTTSTVEQVPTLETAPAIPSVPEKKKRGRPHKKQVQ